MTTIEASIEHVTSGLEAQLKLWGAKLGELMAKAKVAGQEVSIDSHHQLEELKVKLGAAQAKIRAAKAAGGDKWGGFKTDLEASWKDLEGAFKKLAH
jgi:imidazoleglycerol phosphate dehydratase HisB